MSITAAIILGMASQAAPASVDVAHRALAAGHNDAAIAAIHDNDALEQGNPARLINLGIAHARRGETELARSLFEAALRADDGLYLETAGGDWIEARKIAARALAMLDSGAFGQRTLVAARQR